MPPIASPPATREKKRRARTGCLTCRARRVKCDEARPSCRRCVAANVDCAGYEARRVVVPVGRQASGDSQIQDQEHEDSQSPPWDSAPTGKPRAGSTARTSGAIKRDVSGTARTASTRSPAAPGPASEPCSDWPTLVAPVSNPRPDQSPGSGARHILGYHQVLHRTIPALFPPEHLHFWRDELLQEAWSCEYLYLTLVSLGNIHRAAVILACGDERYKASGLDMKITAVHMYTQALQKLGDHLHEAKQTPWVLVAVLCLMAHFEALGGNIPAFMGRVQSAEHYFTSIMSVGVATRSQRQPSTAPMMIPLRDSLRLLRQTCIATLPMALLHRSALESMGPFSQTARPRGVRLATAQQALQGLIDLVSADRDINDLIWSPITPYARHIPPDHLINFGNVLREWRDECLHLIPQLDSDNALESLLVYRWQRFVLPPTPYRSCSHQVSLAAAHYNFYMGRLKWAMLLLGHDAVDNQLCADFYFYEALRHAASLQIHTSVESAVGDAYVPCEALNVGISAMLHIIGLCSPEPAWVEWIQRLCEQVVQEGVLKALAFVKHLGCWHEVETRLRRGRLSPLGQYSAPEYRVIGQLIPEADGRHFISFFAAPIPGSNPLQHGLDTYHVVARARWKCNHGEGPLTIGIEIYNTDGDTLEPFARDWLDCTRPVQEWLMWSGEKEFRIDRALQDHISGTRLLHSAIKSAEEEQLASMPSQTIFYQD